jgi:DNA-binding transcriptional regulator YiaG
VKKLTYYIIKCKGPDQKELILNDQEIVERYKNSLRKHIKTSEIHMTDEDIMKNVRRQGVTEITGALIKQKRLEKGLTQSNVSIACGVGLNTYRYWEMGATTPKKENLLKLLDVLGF